MDEARLRDDRARPYPHFGRALLLQQWCLAALSRHGVGPTGGQVGQVGQIGQIGQIGQMR